MLTYALTHAPSIHCFNFTAYLERARRELFKSGLTFKKEWKTPYGPMPKLSGCPISQVTSNLLDDERVWLHKKKIVTGILAIQ